MVCRLSAKIPGLGIGPILELLLLSFIEAKSQPTKQSIIDTDSFGILFFSKVISSNSARLAAGFMII